MKAQAFALAGVALVAVVVLAIMGPWWSSTPAGPVYGQMTTEPASIIGGTTGFMALDSHNPGYLGMFGESIDNIESRIQQLMPIGGTIAALSVRTIQPLPAGSTYNFTVRMNGSDTSVSCTISESQPICSDQSNSVAFSAQDLISVKYVQGGVSFSDAVVWTATFTPSPPSSSVGGFAELPLVAGTGGAPIGMGTFVLLSAGVVLAFGAALWYHQRRLG